LGGSFGFSGSCIVNLRPVDENVFDLRFFIEQIAVGDNQIGDLSLLNRTEPVANSKNFRRRQSQRPQCRIRRKPRVDRFSWRLSERLSAAIPPE